MPPSKDPVANYHRPSDPFQCGMAANGERCSSGPSCEGLCPTASCEPTYRLAWWQRHFRSTIALIGICIVVILFCTPWHREFLAPGPLTQAHAQILQNNNANRCAACHDQGKFPALAWLSPTHPVAGPTVDQSELCMKCHLAELPSLAKRRPHDLDLEQLERLTQLAKSRPNDQGLQLISSRLTGSSTPIHWRSQALACSDCHREHHGTQFDLQALTQTRCQSCHTNTFESFAKGHPEFNDYPYTRASHIAFDHNKHRDLHFAKENKTFQCTQCHLQENAKGAVGQVFRSVSFEVACASCHNPAIQTSLSDGIVVFQLPSLDRAKLQKLASGNLPEFLERWPEEASQMMDGTIPPIMQILLAGEEEGEQLLKALPASTNLSELDLNRSKDRELALQLAEVSQKLLKEIATEGQKSIQRRLTQWSPSSNPPKLVSTSEPASSNLRNTESLSKEWSAKLLEGIPPDLFRTAQIRWFDANTSTSEQEDLKPIKPLQHLPAGGWMIDQRRMAILYIPKGHADPWLTAWTNLAKRIQATTLRSREEDALASWNSETNAPSKPVVGQGLLQANHTGKCLECHTPLAMASNTLPLATSRTPLVASQENQWWRSNLRNEAERLATRFNHGPHLLLPSTSCESCHQLSGTKRLEQPSNDTLVRSYLPASAKTLDSASTRWVSFQSPAQASPHNHRSDFAPMKKSDCSQCHRPNAAGDTCTQCHNYHIKP